MGSSICWHANSVLIDFLLSHILLGTGICSYIYHTFRPKKSLHKSSSPIPIGSMYGIFTYIYHKNQPNVGKYTIVPWILWPIEVWCFLLHLIEYPMIPLQAADGRWRLRRGWGAWTLSMELLVIIGDRLLGLFSGTFSSWVVVVSPGMVLKPCK